MGLPGSYALPDPPSPEEALNEPAPPNPDLVALGSVGLPAKVITGFFVFLTEEGFWFASSNLVGAERDGGGQITKMGTLPPIDAIEVQREASLQEMGRATVQVSFDIGAQLSSKLAAIEIDAMAKQQMMAATARAEAAAILDRVRGGSLQGPDGRPMNLRG